MSIWLMNTSIGALPPLPLSAAFWWAWAYTSLICFSCSALSWAAAVSTISSKVSMIAQILFIHTDINVTQISQNQRSTAEGKVKLRIGKYLAVIQHHL